MDLKRELAFFLALFFLILPACNLTGGGDDEDSQASPTANVNAAASQPTVEINSPLTGSEVAVNQEVLVYSIARDSAGVTRIELRENGAVINTINSPNPSGQTELASLQKWTPIQTGTYRLEVVAYHNETASDPASVEITVVGQASQVTTPVATPLVVVPVATADTTCRVRILLDQLNVLSQPSSVANSVQTTTLGEVIPLLGRTAGNEWFEVNVRGQRGWIDAAYTARLGNCASLPVTGEVVFVPTATATSVAVAPTSTTIPVQSGGGVVATATLDPRVCRAVITTDNVTARSAPDENSTAILTLRANTNWEVFQRTGDGSWWQINVNGVLAWIPSGSIAIRGECSGVLVATASATTTLTVTVTSSATVTATSTETPTQTVTPSITPTVLNPADNRPPVIDPINPQEVQIGQTILVPVNVTDPEGATPILSASSAAPEIALAEINSAGGLEVSGLAAGQATINVIADDTQGKQSNVTFRVTVVTSSEPNQPPVIAPIEDVTLAMEETVTVVVEVSDPEGVNTFFSAIVSSAETIATAESDGAGNLLVTALAPGRARISVTASDGSGGTATASFNVVVLEPATATPDAPPVITPIQNQTLVIGSELLVLPVEASDPEGTTVFFAELESSAETIVTAESDGAGNLLLEGLVPGTAQITLTVEDGTGNQSSTSFTVTVLEATPIPNDAPIVAAIPEQTVEAGETLTVPVEASDPEGTTVFFAEVSSSAETIATVESDGAGNLLITGVAAGQTDVTVIVEDGDGQQTPVTFTVRVSFTPTETPLPNEAPLIEPIAPQTVVIGNEPLILPVSAVDPEGTTVFFAELESSAETIATVESDGAGNLIVTGIAAGTAEMTLTVEDGDGNQSSTNFTVTVVEPTPVPNDAPIIDPIGDQAVFVGETITVPINVTDPEGTTAFFAEITSSAETIVTAESDGAGNLLITGIAPGTAQINLVAEDGDGEQSTSSLRVVVSLAPTATPVPNDPPQISPIGEQLIQVGDTLVLPVTVVDPDGTTPFFAEIESAAETIATAESDGAGNLLITGVAPGTTQITLTAEDGDGLQSEASFNVTVFEPTPTPNELPIIAPIADQTLILGNDPILIPVTVTDPEGTTPFFAEIESAADTIAIAESDGAGNLILTPLAAGQTQITLTAEDGDGGQSSLSFNITVLEPTATPNNSPTIETIPDQTLILGNDPILVPVTASDPEGVNTFFAEILSAADTIATAESDGAGNLILTPISAGQTQITVVVDDGSGLQAETTFTVTVLEPTPIPDEVPLIDPIGDQTLGVGETVTVIINSFDPEGTQTFLAEITSSADTIATGAPDGTGNVLVTGVSAGQAALTVVVEDGTGKQSEMTFQVLVTAPPTEIAQENQPPAFAAVPDQVVDMGGFVTVPLNVTDPEGTPVTLSAISSDETIAQVQTGEGAVTIAGSVAGTATITVTGTDAGGGSSSLTFLVTVAEGAVPTEPDLPDSPLASVPELPDFTDAQFLAGVQSLYTAGQPNVFIVIGDVTDRELLGAAGDGVYDLSGASDVQSTLDVYLNQPLGAGNVLNAADGAANPNWKTADLINPANNPEGCAESNPIACAMVAYQPSVVVVMVGRNDVLESTPIASFETNLQLMVQTIQAYGAIPVLATLPGAPTQVDAYNEAIATFADNNGLPLWNLWRSIPVEQVNSDLTLTSPGDGQNALLTTENLTTYGAVKRNEMLLRLLQLLRQNVPLQ